MLRTDGGYAVPGMPGNGGVMSPAVRFNPNDLRVQPSPGYLNDPSYSPFRQGLDRDRFILLDPRSGVANNPAPGGSPYSELPKDYLEQRNPFGAPPTPTQQPGQPGVPVQLELPLAGSSNLPNALPGAPGNAAGMLMAQLPGGEQGPAQGPNTPIKFYPGLGYAPYVQRG